MRTGQHPPCCGSAPPGATTAIFPEQTFTNSTTQPYSKPGDDTSSPGARFQRPIIIYPSPPLTSPQSKRTVPLPELHEDSTFFSSPQFRQQQDSDQSGDIISITCTFKHQQQHRSAPGVFARRHGRPLLGALILPLSPPSSPPSLTPSPTSASSSGPSSPGSPTLHVQEPDSEFGPGLVPCGSILGTVQVLGNEGCWSKSQGPFFHPFANRTGPVLRGNRGSDLADDPANSNANVAGPPSGKFYPLTIASATVTPPTPSLDSQSDMHFLDCRELAFSDDTSSLFWPLTMQRPNALSLSPPPEADFGHHQTPLHYSLSIPNCEYDSPRLERALFCNLDTTATPPTQAAPSGGLLSMLEFATSNGHDDPYASTGLNSPTRSGNRVDSPPYHYSFSPGSLGKTLGLGRPYLSNDGDGFYATPDEEGGKETPDDESDDNEVHLARILHSPPPQLLPLFPSHFFDDDDSSISPSSPPSSVPSSPTSLPDIDDEEEEELDVTPASPSRRKLAPLPELECDGEDDTGLGQDQADSPDDTSSTLSPLFTPEPVFLPPEVSFGTSLLLSPPDGPSSLLPNSPELSPFEELDALPDQCKAEGRRLHDLWLQAIAAEAAAKARETELSTYIANLGAVIPNSSPITSSTAGPQEQVGLLPPLELTTLDISIQSKQNAIAERAQEKRLRKLEKEKGKEIGMLLKLKTKKLFSGVQQASVGESSALGLSDAEEPLPYWANERRMSYPLPTTPHTSEHNDVTQLVAKMVFRRRDPSHKQALRRSSTPSPTSRNQSYVRSPLAFNVHTSDAFSDF